MTARQAFLNAVFAATATIAFSPTFAATHVQQLGSFSVERSACGDVPVLQLLQCLIQDTPRYEETISIQVFDEMLSFDTSLGEVTGVSVRVVPNRRQVAVFPQPVFVPVPAFYARSEARLSDSGFLSTVDGSGRLELAFGDVVPSVIHPEDPITDRNGCATLVPGFGNCEMDLEVAHFGQTFAVAGKIFGALDLDRLNAGESIQATGSAILTVIFDASTDVTGFLDDDRGNDRVATRNWRFEARGTLEAVFVYTPEGQDTVSNENTGPGNEPAPIPLPAAGWALAAGLAALAGLRKRRT